MASGVFGLRKVYKKQVENVDNNNFASWPESGIYGYFGGGFAPPTVATIDRIDFSNETTSVPGNNLPQARWGLAAVSSSSYGYFGGGYAPPYVATIDRIDFSSETTSAPGNNLPQARIGLATISNNFYGYFGGGEAPILSQVATIDRIDFSSETTSAPGNNLSQARVYLAATSSDLHGYFGAGYTPGITPNISALIDRIDFSTETRSTPGNNLSQERYLLAATSSDSYGYFGGGTIPPQVATIDRIDFINETTSAPGNNLPQGRIGLSATSSGLYGYFAGGYTSPPTTRVAIVDRIDFINETFSVPGNDLPQARNGLAAVSGGASVTRANGYGTYGYHIGGWGPPAICNITRQDFSSNTFSDVGTIPSSLYGNDRSAYNDFYGYFGGGYAATPPPAIRRSSIYRLDFLNESLKTLTNTLPQIADKIAHTSTREVGYFGGGYTYPPIPATWHSKICKLDFSSESVSTLPASGRLSAQKGGSSAVRTPQYAFFGGGYNQIGPSSYSKIDRLDFSTEVASAYTNMTRANVLHTSIESRTHGYYWGGGNGFNDADKLQFSNGTVTNLPGIVGSNPYYYYQNSQTDSYYGYFFGGGWQPYPFSGSFGETLVRRLDFSSDTVTILSPKIPRKAGTSASMSNKYD